MNNYKTDVKSQPESQNESFVEGILKDIETHFQEANQTRVVTADELMKRNLKEIPYLVDSLFMQRGLACVAGASDTGKSRLLRQLALSVINDHNNFLGFPLITKTKCCIYVSTEDDEQSTAVLLQKQASGFSEEVLKRLRFIFDTHNLLEKVDAELSLQPADIVIIDSFSDIFGQDLKDSTKIRSCLHQFKLLADKHECLFLFLHHTGKRTEDIAPSKNNLLSGQGLEAKMRMVIEFRLDQIDPSLRHLCIVKANYLPPAYKTESFVLQFDEQLHAFINTGERVPFEYLVKQEANELEQAKYEQAIDLKKQGKTYEEIAAALGYSSKSAVTKLIARVEKRRN